jgi:hypothetical protein
MKVAITCDTLINRNHYTEIVETICEAFPEARLYCFVHLAGKILGHIEQRVITSTYLSHEVKTEEEFWKKSYQFPRLANNLFVSCEYDLIINISNGFSQGFKKCDKSKMITFLYDDDYEKKIRTSIIQKIFYSYVFSWAQKSLKNADMVLVAREDMRVRTQMYAKNVEVVPPPFRISDYSLFPKEMFPHHFFLVEADGITELQAQQIIDWMREWSFEFQFIGNDEHLNSLKIKHPENKFFGNKCSGEHTPVLAASKAFISFNEHSFPNLALGTMATGRPVILAYNLKKWVSGNGTYFTSLSKESLKLMIEEVIADESNLEPQKIRANAIHYHDIKFKAKIKRVVEDLMGLKFT